MTQEKQEPKPNMDEEFNEVANEIAGGNPLDDKEDVTIARELKEEAQNAMDVDLSTFRELYNLKEKIYTVLHHLDVLEEKLRDKQGEKLIFPEMKVGELVELLKDKKNEISERASYLEEEIEAER